jgi:hypothetical protein
VEVATAGAHDENLLKQGSIPFQEPQPIGRPGVSPTTGAEWPEAAGGKKKTLVALSETSAEKRAEAYTL